MSTRSRREFLITTGAGMAAGLFLPGMAGAGESARQAPPALRTRKNVMSVAAQGDLASLKKGVGELRKLATSKPTDPRGWVLQAFIHGNCNGFRLCQHGNWYFPPWHRSYLYYFEQLIQEFSSDPNFALPYWDWSRTISVPASFYGTTNPLNDILSISSSCAGAPTAGRGRTQTEQFSQSDQDTYVGVSVVNGIQQNPDYATYGGTKTAGGALERTPHNFVHRWVGGSKASNMVRSYSPLDPIFWMHHCNIDRLYSNWLGRPNHLPPKETEWKKKSFNDFFDKKGNPAGGDFTCEMTLDSKVMGYVYDRSFERIFTQAPPTPQIQPAGPGPQIIGNVVAAKMTKQAGVLTFASEAPAANLRQAMNTTALGASDHVVRLYIEGVKSPSQQNTGVRVFIGPGITATTPITAPGYVGSFTFFDGQGSGDHAHAAQNVVLNASAAMQRLYGDTAMPEGGVSVSLVTRALYTGVSTFATVEEIQPERVQFEVVDLDG